jgi:hypothetical protein
MIKNHHALVRKTGKVFWLPFLQKKEAASDPFPDDRVRMPDVAIAIGHPCIK